jgi:hypothetical protein
MTVQEEAFRSDSLEPVLAQLVCARCKREIAADAAYCPHCGQRVTVANPQAWLDNPWAMMGILFFGIGPLALPMLWRSRAFGPLGKWLLTILVLALTVVVVVGLVWVVGLMGQLIAALSE